MCERVACFLILLSAGQSLGTPPESQKVDPDLWNGGPPADPKHPQTWNYTGRNTSGIVQGIDKDGITLYRVEVEVLHWRHDPLSGESFGVKRKETFPAVPAKNFLLAEELTKGEYVKTALPANTYRVTDVRVGDWVSIEYERRNGVDVCKALCIDRRPGGRIPPAPGEKPDAFNKYHEQANARQDWEEKRIAYPRKYWPSYRGQDGKLYVGPYPSESIQIVLKKPVPLAPAPREAKP
jgi:hypothetical protein